MDLYEDFAERYDLTLGLSGEHDPQLVEFFHQLFIQNNVQTLLDCACGTGRHLPLFQSIGCQVTGSDISGSMLQQARQNLIRLGSDIPLYQVDFRQLPGYFHQQFDAVMCLAAIGFMPGEMEFLKAFKSMAQVLRPGGILVLTTMPTDRQWKERPRFILNSSRRDFSRIFAIDYFEHSACFNILDIFHNCEASELKVWSAELYPLLRDDQERLMLVAGFRAIDFYGSFDFSPYDKSQSNNLITVAHLEEVK
jgi:ubiquinone/menaquinone biosynthesis C-methylase UbiE